MKTTPSAVHDTLANELSRFNPTPSFTKNTSVNSPSPQSSLKIAIVSHCLYPIAQPYAGGLEMITQLLCDELVARGHDVTLYAHQDSVTTAKLKPYMSRHTFEAIIYPNEHESLGMSRDELYQSMVYQDAMCKIIEKCSRDEFDIVHNHSLHYVPMLMGQALGQRLITTFHTPIFAHLRLALLTLQYGTKSQFTSVSQFQQQLFDQFVPSQVVHNGIDVDAFEPNIGALEDEHYFWLGRICPEKGTHLAIQYCLEAGKKLIIAGPKSNKEYYETEVAPLLAKDAAADGEHLLQYVGHLTKDQINTQLQQATAMLFTSTWEEPYGLTLAESLACGCPVIGFAVGAASEIITDDTGIIVPKLDKKAFLEAFNHIHDISRQDCRDRAKTSCSVDAMVDGYLECYKQTVATL